MSVPAAYLGIILIWSTTPLAIKWSGEGSGFLFGVSARIILGTVICLLILKLMKMRIRWDKQAVLTYFAAAIGIYGAMLTVYWGAQFIPSGMISVLFGLTPLLTAILAAIFLNEGSLTYAKLGGIVLGIVGLVVIFKTDLVLQDGAIMGIAFVIFSTFLHSFSTVMVKKIGCDLPAMVISGGGLLVASCLFLLTWLISNDSLPQEIPMHAGASIIYLGIFGTVVGFSLFYYALKHINASKIGLIPVITPVLALMIGKFLNQEETSVMIWTGTAFISLGLLIHQWGDGITILRMKNKSA